ncbi:MAG: DUF1116 domain-containing protein [Candidatus Riflebacteria bacterium]|nr:DUF1116 domain-containing protein [Candidatus Riflebacteria bacterium]
MAKVNIETANIEAIKRIQSAQPVLTGIGIAQDVVPGMRKNLILHAGPPITWQRMSGPMRGAVMGALMYEGLAKDPADAEKVAASGEVKFEPWHEHSGVGPMAGVATSSMPVWIVENKTHGNKAYCTLNEGLGKVLRFGAFSPEVITHLKWMENVLAPLLKETLAKKGDVNLKSIIAQALQMGDEVHNRNRAGTSLLFRELAPCIIDTSFSVADKKRVLEFINSNDHFFLNLSMPAAKAILASAEWISGSTIVTTMARNGTDFGIRLSGLKDRWFTAPALKVSGLYFPGFSEEDANPDIGDSAITETCGLGAFSMASAPAIVKFVGGKATDSIEYTRRMYEITETESDHFQIPSLDFRGSPTGINLLKVCETGILPQINTGIAHKNPGIGQVGAGLVNPPVKCFEDALEAFVEAYCPEKFL